METLGKQGLRAVTEEQAENPKRGLTIPEDFSAKILSKERTVFDFFKVDGSGGTQSMLAEVIVFRAVVAFNGYLVEHAMETGGDAALTEQALRAVMEEANPLVLEARFAGRKPIPVGFNASIAVPGATPRRRAACGEPRAATCKDTVAAGARIRLQRRGPSARSKLPRGPRTGPRCWPPTRSRSRAVPAPNT